jgi:hypothetical protein
LFHALGPRETFRRANEAILSSREDRLKPRRAIKTRRPNNEVWSCGTSSSA